jgi:hypothetical protein
LTRGPIAALAAATILLASAGAAAPVGAARDHDSSTGAPVSALPLYRFAKTSGGALPWDATPLSPLVGPVTLGAGPRSTTGAAGQQAVAFATTSRTLAAMVTSGPSTSFVNLANVATPPASSSPTPFFDSGGRLNLAYVTTNGHVILVTQNTLPGAGELGPPIQFLHHDWLVHDLTSESGLASSVAAASSQVDTVSLPGVDLVALRSAGGALVQLTVNAQRPFAVTATTTVAPSVSSDPVYAGPLADGIVTLAAVSPAGHMEVFRRTLGGVWNTTDVTGGLGSPALSGNIAATAANGSIYVAGIQSASGDVELAVGALGAGVLHWTRVNATTASAANAATGAGPALSGRVAIAVTSTHVEVAGPAAGWGDLFDYSGTYASAKWTWVATDVSATGGSSAKTIGTQVAATVIGAQATLVAGGVATPAPRGVGMYAIPQSQQGRAIVDGWRILGDTGGLGTQARPWTNVKWSPVTSSPDYLTGLAIQNSHRRVTWLSFWTVSGPEGGETVAPGTFRAHGAQAAAAIAHQVDAYRTTGLGLKPDWVILDPEGFPDNHSGLDSIAVASVTGNGKVATVTTIAPSGIAVGMTINMAGTGHGELNVIKAPVLTTPSPKSFTFASGFRGTARAGIVVAPALVKADWSALLAGWRDGMAAVDPSLRAAVYADESEYHSASLGALAMPVFMAIAWVPPSSPQPIAHTGNVLGYIEWGNNCSSGTFQKQLSMLVHPPWNGFYNTIQLDPGLYCKPTAR